jgi:hypothetical protein
MNAYQRYKQNRRKIERLDVDIKEFKVNDDNRTVIIVPFRESNPKTLERTNQLLQFAKHYHNYISNVEILIIEQSNDKKKFTFADIMIPIIPNCHDITRNNIHLIHLSFTRESSESFMHKLWFPYAGNQSHF